MINILLVRAGKTDYDCQNRIQGVLDLPLSEEGWQKVAALAEELHQQSVDAIYAGPDQASQQTAELVSVSLQQKVKTNKDLHNLDLGLWQGMLIEDVKNKQPKVYKQWIEHPETVCPPEGESLSAAQDRLQTALDKITKKYKDGTVALVLAEPLASLLCNLVREDDLGNLWTTCCKSRPAWELLARPSEAVAIANGTVISNDTADTNGQAHPNGQVLSNGTVPNLTSPI
ncbi:MAG: histidine phosphatase family protein [Bythopirellula sp.]|nr:histidine phosphatase family protein [Bythopirellula sp.]